MCVCAWHVFEGLQCDTWDSLQPEYLSDSVSDTCCLYNVDPEACTFCARVRHDAARIKAGWQSICTCVCAEGGECAVDLDVFISESRKELFCSMANHCPKQTTTYSMLRR